MPDVEILFAQQHSPSNETKNQPSTPESIDVEEKSILFDEEKNLNLISIQGRSIGEDENQILSNSIYANGGLTPTPLTMVSVSENEVNPSFNSCNYADVEMDENGKKVPSSTNGTDENWNSRDERALTSANIDPTMLANITENGNFGRRDGEAEASENEETDFIPFETSVPNSALPRFGLGKFIQNGQNHLETVLENLPCESYEIKNSNSDEKMRSISPSIDHEGDDGNKVAGIGHSRSVHNFGPADYMGVTNLAQPQQPPSTQNQTAENRRTHARHSSYEVPSSQQRPGIGLAPTSNGCCVPFGRTNSLSRTGTDASSFSSSFSISSLSYSDYSASLASINDGGVGNVCVNGCDHHNQQQFFHQHHSHDENSSKRSSLDRRSLTSYSSSASSSNDETNHRINDSINSTDSTTCTSSGNQNKRLLPLTNILPRGLFSRKTLSISPNNQTTTTTQQNGTTTAGTSWKLPFRPPAALASTFGSALLSNSKHGTPANQHGNKDLAADAPSTTALILQDRPATLPPKSADEEHRHRQLYEQMIEAAKKKEQKEAKQRKKQQRLQIKQEDMLSAAVKEWTAEILPKWDEMKHSKKVRELWGQGLPPCVRGKVWKLAIGNELSITEELFEICVNRAKERLRQFEEASTNPNAANLSGASSPLIFNTPPTSPSSSSMSTYVAESPVDREGTVELIHLDVARTFPVLGIFQKGGPYYDLLLNVLGAYACYRPDVGYVQGMSFLAAVLLLNMDAPDTFIAFANLMNRPCQLAFFRLRQADMERYFLAYDKYFHECLPKLYAHFKQLDVRPNLYLIEWLYTLYAKSLPLEVTCRIWDAFVRDGEEFLFRTAIGILHQYEDVLLRTDFDRCVQFLTHLPDNLRASDLFRSIDEAAPAQSSSSFYPTSVRHATSCGGGLTVGGGHGEKKRFMHFFNELSTTAPDRCSSSSATSGCSSPNNSNHQNHTPSILFTYASNLLSSSNTSINLSQKNSNSGPSSRGESGAQKISAENEKHFEQSVDKNSDSENQETEKNICHL